MMPRTTHNNAPERGIGGFMQATSTLNDTRTALPSSPASAITGAGLALAICIVSLGGLLLWLGDGMIRALALVLIAVSLGLTWQMLRQPTRAASLAERLDQANALQIDLAAATIADDSAAGHAFERFSARLRSMLVELQQQS